MTTQPIIDTPQNWDLASEGYAQKIAPIMMESFAETFVSALDVDDTMDALEVAAGSGALTETLARHVKTLLATDFAPEMINILKERITQTGILNTRCSVMDGQNLELDDNIFDRAACSFGLMLFPDRSCGFSELHRVVRPGGKVLVSGWAGPDKFEAFALFLQSLERVFPDMPKPDSPPPVFSLSDPLIFKAEMLAAGFNDVSVEYVTQIHTIESTEALWDMLTSGAPPIRLLFDKVGQEGKLKVREAISDIINEKFGNGKIELSNTATMGLGLV